MTIPLPTIGTIVGYDEVLWWYCRFDSALERTDAGKCKSFGPFAGLRALREEVLKEKIPLPLGYRWSYANLTRTIAANSCLWWAPQMKIEGGIQFIENIDHPDAHAKVQKIKDFVEMPDCGVSEDYLDLILVRRPWGQTGLANTYIILEGTHRLCALWQKFSSKGAWPQVACFLGEPQ